MPTELNRTEDDMTTIYDGGRNAVADFKHYEEALRCLPSITKVLGRTLYFYVTSLERKEPLPEGCYVDTNAEKLLRIVCHP
jgi:hypothetical protein